MDWVKAGMPELDVPESDRTTLPEAFNESGRQARPATSTTAFQTVVTGFSVEDIQAPTRIMLARDDTSVPAAHGDARRDPPNAELGRRRLRPGRRQLQEGVGTALLLPVECSDVRLELE